MKYLIKCLLLFLVTTLSTSCSKDDFDITTEEELAGEAVIIEVENSLSYRLNSSTVINTGGVAYKNPATLPNSVNYFVASDDVLVECKASGGFTASFDGGDLFQFLFYSDDSGAYVVLGDFEIVIDGESVTASSSLVPPACPRERIEVQFTELDGRLQGTFTGEFFKLASEIISPFESCENYVSLGILQASFDLELIDC